MSYTKIVFTKHARERLDLRTVSEDMVIQAIQKPNKAYLQDNGDTKFIAKVNGCKIHAVCKPLPEEDKWLVKTLWVRGEDDNGNFVRYSKSYQGRGTGSSIRSSAALYSLIAFLILLAVWYFMGR